MVLIFGEFLTNYLQEQQSSVILGYLGGYSGQLE